MKHLSCTCTGLYTPMSVSSTTNPVELHTRLTDTFRRLLDEELDDLRNPLFWRAVFAEFLGCLLLLFFSVGAGLCEPGGHCHSSVHTSLAAGFFIAIIISALANTSGAHVNPALSLAFAFIREISVVRFIFYSIAQSTGALVGAALVQFLLPSTMHGNLGLLQPGKSVTVEQALVTEIIIGFFLVFVIFSLVDKGRKDIGGCAPFIVGLTVSLNILSSGHISGGCMNPVRNLAPAVVLGNYKLQWVYWVGPMVGAVTGGLFYDKVFSVKAEKCGLLSVVVNRPFEEVGTDDTPIPNEEIRLGTSTVTDWQAKHHLCDCVEESINCVTERRNPNETLK